MRPEHWLYTVPLRLRSLFHRRRVEEELDEELRYHLENKTAAYMDKGLNAAEARRAALREFGGIEQAKEECRDTRQVRPVETLLQDVRFGARALRKHPGYTTLAVLTLALGLGANTAIFSLVNGILLRPLPFAAPERLVAVTGTFPKGAVVALRQRVRTLDVAAYAEGHALNLTGVGEPVRVSSTLVSAELFSILGAAPALGRTFRPDEDRVGRDQYVLLSDALWRQRFARDPAIVGRSIELDGVLRQVVGVMPGDFRFPSAETQVWVPLRNDPRDNVSYWAGDFMPVIGRLRPGATLPQAHGEIRAFHPDVVKMFPWPMPSTWNRDVGVVPLRNGMVADVQGRLIMLFGAVGLVLLIACANVANLTLSRAATREREMGIRVALGAGRARIVRQLLTESVLLALAGGAVGVLLATQGLSMLKAWLPADTPRLADVEIDWRVLAVTAGLALATGIVFGLAPALHASRRALSGALKAGGKGTAAPVSQRLRSALVVAQVALAVLLVIAAGLLIRSLRALSLVNPGFRSENVLTARITPSASFCAEAARCLTFYRTALDHVRAIPGIESAALVNTPPLGGSVAKRNVNLEGLIGTPTETAPLFWLDIVTPDYFRVLGIPLAAGRGFTEADRTGNPGVAILAASTARRYWPGQDPIGKHLRFVGSEDWLVVIGVVSDVRAYDLERHEPEWMQGTMYVPHSPRATLEDGRVPSEMTLVVRTAAEDSYVAASLRKVVAGLNRDVPVGDVISMRAMVADAVSTPASTATLFGAFAALALILGMVGIYGVLSFLVSRRTHEIGLRRALGARHRDVLWLVLREGAKLACVGIALGLSGAFAVMRLLARELYGVTPMDPVTYVSVAVVMTVVTLAACAIPAVRGMRVDPLIALRQE
jgi:predicted permease